MARPESLDELLIEELRDLLDAENQLTKALPKMAKAAESPLLRQAFERHLEETRGQIVRLNQAFEGLGQNPRRKSCPAMKGLLTEGNELMSELDRGSVRDAALIGAAQKVEHYEMAAYGTARTFATRIGEPEVARLLEATLNEEKTADGLLTQIAEGLVNEEAAEGESTETEGLATMVARSVEGAAGAAVKLARSAGRSLSAAADSSRASLSRKSSRSSSAKRSSGRSAGGRKK